MAHSACMINVAGHICLDLIPSISARKDSLPDLLAPGKLLNVGPVTTSTGGAVANTGIGLHRLGCQTRLIGKVGDDPFGRIVLDHLRSVSPQLAESMLVEKGGSTSYTVVIIPPGIDRVFMHCPGANDTFSAIDLDAAWPADGCMFHFGYPPLMKRMYASGGEELAAILSRAHNQMVTSLDMAMPDPDSDSGKVDWQTILRRILPITDLFMPSYEELCYMLGQSEREDRLATAADMAEWLVLFGAGVVAIKLGEEGLYIHTTGKEERLRNLFEHCGCRPEDWLGREMWCPCFEVKVAGTTGSGDATIAGFLASLCEGASPEQAANMATAVGACACEQPDATSGIPSKSEILSRIAAGWPILHTQDPKDGWRWQEDHQIWIGPRDRGAHSPASQ